MAPTNCSTRGSRVSYLESCTGLHQAYDEPPAAATCLSCPKLLSAARPRRPRLDLRAYASFDARAAAI
jgi:hypothetical protein